METFDLGIVGGGVMGLSLLRSAGRAGLSAVLFEQFEIGHGQGSSHGPARAFAIPHLQPELVQMAADASPLWQEMAQDQANLYWRQGAMLRTPDPAPVVAALSKAGTDHEVVAPAAVYERFGITLPGPAPVVYTPDGGTLRSDLALSALRAEAERLGGVIRERTPVHKIAESDAGAVLATAAGDVFVRHVAVAAAGWTPELVKPLGIDLPVRVTMQTVAYFRHPGAAAIPALYEVLDTPVYWVSSEADVIRIGRHDEEAASPRLGTRGEPDEVAVELLAKHIATRLPDADPTPLDADTCLYNHTSGSFVVERRGHVTACVACEGRGFKFAPLIADRVIAGLARP